MECPVHQKIVPAQEEGRSITAESSIEMTSERQAIYFFTVVKSHLQQVDHWHELAAGLSARFQLLDEKGEISKKPPQPGNYFRIDIPGPGTVSGEGFDWVKVEEIINEVLPNTEIYGFRVRPAGNPVNRSGDTAHFFSAESTSSFIVCRDGNTITTAVYDRNIKPNTDAINIVDKVRDLITGSVGMLIFSKLQWKKLTEGLLQKIPE